MDDSQTRCPVCGNPTVEPGENAGTVPGSAPPPTRGTTRTIGGTRSHGSHSVSRDPSSAVSQGRFLPGTMLADRYRIVAPLGKGGMGEVYRADDLKLGQAVALKLLPEDFNRDEARLTRFLGEVKIARRVSHPNVCRVYDIGDVDGQHFISMEYVDGEDLSSLLRRIGRLPEDKAVQIARELCAGMAAAHDKGVLHRDLKPANVMIDGEGRVSITDFGLAAISGEIDEDDVLSGTPAYMAPEQLAGTDASVQSDIFALGLILYEMLTGKRAYNGNGIAEMARLHRDSTPATPSSLTPGLDPLVERVVLRCLDRDPALRPTSALQVAAALPGGDPLAAALAAGETPSPQMVAAAGTTEGMAPGKAWLCLAGILIGMALLPFLMTRSQMALRAPVGKAPAIMAERAAGIAARLGYAEAPRDRMYGTFSDQDMLTWVGRDSSLTAGYRYEDDVKIHQFWYRQSPRTLIPFNLMRYRPSFRDPPVLLSGMVNVTLDAEGNLLSFLAVPPEVDSGDTTRVEPDFGLFFGEAGLDPDTFSPVNPEWNQSVAADTRAAWTGTDPRSKVPIRIEAGSWRGAPVYFTIIWPWSRPARMEQRPVKTSERVSQALNIGVFLLVLIVGGLVAARNMRRGSSDNRGALRLGLFMFGTQFAVWIFVTHHVADNVELGYFNQALAGSLLTLAMAAMFYLAIEPYVRRLYPDRLITWVRILNGRFRDPLVGRDLLIGILFGVVMAVVGSLRCWIPDLFGTQMPRPDLDTPPINLAESAASLSQILMSSVMNALVIMSLFILLRVLLRKAWAAGTVMVLLLAAIIGPASVGTTPPDIVATMIVCTLIMTVLLRFGLLASMGAFLLTNMLGNFPVGIGVNSWFTAQSIAGWLLMVGLTIYAFVISLGGKAVFKDSLLDEG